MASHQALLIIDYTNDFVADGGALTCGQPGQALAPTIVKLANQMATASDWVLLPTDVHTPHDPYHPESKLFPPHNVRGTWGRELYGPLKDWYADHQAADNVWHSTRRVTVHLRVLIWIYVCENAMLTPCT